MLSKYLAPTALAVLGGAAMLAVSMTPASAFTLASPSLQAPVAGAQIEKVWWDRWGRWHGPHYWGPRHCWRGYHGYVHCN